MWWFILFFVLTLVAEVLGTVGGFGSSVFFVPVATYFFPIHEVLGITALFHLFSNVSKLALFRKGLDKKLFLSFGIPAIVLVAVGAWLSQHVPVRWLELTLAGFLVLLAVYFLWKKDQVIPPTPGNTLIGGLLSGFFAGLVGTGGAIRGAFLASYNLEKSAFIATSAIIDLGIDSTRFVVYASQGYVKAAWWWMVPLLLGISFLGSWLGKLWLEHISQDLFKRLVLLLILGVGLATLLKALYHYAQ